MNFETGKTYSTRSIGDYNCVISVTVVRRTAKMIEIAPRQGDAQTKFRVSRDHTGAECIKPWGSFSMAPTISADNRHAA